MKKTNMVDTSTTGHSPYHERQHYDKLSCQLHATNMLFQELTLTADMLLGLVEASVRDLQIARDAYTAALLCDRLNPETLLCGDDVINSWLMMHKGADLKPYKSVEIGTGTASMMAMLNSALQAQAAHVDLPQGRIQTVMCRTSDHSVVVAKLTANKSSKWVKLDSLHTSYTNLEVKAVKAFTIWTLHLTSNAAFQAAPSAAAPRAAAPPAAAPPAGAPSSTDSAAACLAAAAPCSATAAPAATKARASSSHLSATPAALYMERQDRQMCLLHSYNAAVGSAMLRPAAVLKWVKKMSDTLKERVAAARLQIPACHTSASPWAPHG